MSRIVSSPLFEVYPSFAPLDAHAAPGCLMRKGPSSLSTFLPVLRCAHNAFAYFNRKNRKSAANPIKRITYWRAKGLKYALITLKRRPNSAVK
jgi:hypothetical protein